MPTEDMRQRREKINPNKPHKTELLSKKGVVDKQALASDASSSCISIKREEAYRSRF